MSGPVIVATGGANIASLQFAIARLGRVAIVSAEASVIERGSHVILPGVGAAWDAMARLEEADLANVIRGLKQPVLGICLGMQLLYESSDEGNTPCLGILPGRVRCMEPTIKWPVPHMGWNRISIRRDHALIAGIDDGGFAYFVHSHCAPVGDEMTASCTYRQEFAAIACRDNFFGVQFHPERSAVVGSRLLANFLELN